MTTKTPGQVLYEAEWVAYPFPWGALHAPDKERYEARAQAVITAHLSTHPPASGGVACLGMTVEQLAAAIEFGGGVAWPAEKVAYLHRLISESISAAPEAPTSQAPDTLRLDFMSAHRVAVIPEIEGGWDAEEFNEDGEGCRVATGQTVRGAIDAARAALEAPKP